MTTNNPEEYNGYPNYQTWAVALWIDNDAGSQEYWQQQGISMRDAAYDGELDYQPPITEKDAATFALADLLKYEHEEGMPETTGVYADLLNSALGRVDWIFIARNIIDEIC